MNSISNKVDIYVNLDGNKITFKNLGTFTLMPKQLEFVKGFKYGQSFLFSSLPDGKITYFVPYKSQNKDLTIGKNTPFYFDLERKKHYDTLKLELLALIVAGRPIIDEDSKTFVINTYKELYSNMYGKSDKVKGSDDDDRE